MTEGKKTYRLVTRSDMDGLVCAILLKELGLIDDILFVHPKDVQDGKVELNENDITTNLPYNPAVHLCLDHHASETLRIAGDRDNRVIDPEAPSASRVVYNHFGGKSVFQSIPDDLMTAVDKADAAWYTREDVLDPKGWELLSFLMDARTGLGRFRDFRISNYALMMDLIDYCRDHTIEQILTLPDVAERVEIYQAHKESSREQILRCSTVYDNLVVLDLRYEDTIYTTNRFMIYALFPPCNISIHLMWGLKKQNTVFAVGKLIFNRTSKTDIGTLMLEYHGGGHAGAGTCQVANEQAGIVKEELIRRITADG